MKRSTLWNSLPMWTARMISISFWIICRWFKWVKSHEWRIRFTMDSFRMLRKIHFPWNQLSKELKVSWGRILRISTKVEKEIRKQTTVVCILCWRRSPKNVGFLVTMFPSRSTPSLMPFWSNYRMRVKRWSRHWRRILFNWIGKSPKNLVNTLFNGILGISAIPTNNSIAFTRLLFRFCLTATPIIVSLQQPF